MGQSESLQLVADFLREGFQLGQRDAGFVGLGLDVAGELRG